MRSQTPRNRDTRRSQMGAPKPKGLAPAVKAPAGLITPRAQWLMDLVASGAIHNARGFLRWDVVDPDTGLAIKAEKPPPRKCPMCGTPHERKGTTCSNRCAKRKQVQTRRRAELTAGQIRRKRALMAAYSALRTT